MTEYARHAEARTPSRATVPVALSVALTSVVGMLRVLPISLAILVQSAASAAQAAGDEKSLESSFDLEVKPFLKQYCVRCHNVEKRTSGIRVDHLNPALE